MLEKDSMTALPAHALMRQQPGQCLLTKACTFNVCTGLNLYNADANLALLSLIACHKD